MKRVSYLLFLLLCLGIVPTFAQEVVKDEAEVDSVSTIQPIADEEEEEPIPLNVSLPWMGGMGLNTWNLHQGLNGQVSAGVRVGFGKNNPWRGGSFFSSMSGLYAFPITQNGRWSGAVGGYYSNYRLFGEQVSSVGVMGIVDYKINDRLSASGFVMHDFGVLGQGRNSMASPLLMDWEAPSTTIGAALDMKLSEKVNLNVGVSFTNQQRSYMPMEMFPSGGTIPNTGGVKNDIPQTPTNLSSTGRGGR